MPMSIVRAGIGDILYVIGIKSAMPAAGFKPGNAPIIRPPTMPTNRAITISTENRALRKAGIESRM